MSGHNFDEYIERRGTDCLKWDGYQKKFGLEPGFELLPMWIADMDFKSPQPVADALRKRVELGVYGYYDKGDDFYNSIISWVKRRYHWQIEKEWIVFTPGVVPSLNIAIQAFTEPGDGVIIQQPVYYNFAEGVANNGRTLVNNQLICGDTQYGIDFDDLEGKAANPATKLMILCSPHNPVGRVWTEDELRRVAEICLKNNVLLVSDEVHADIIFKGYRHVTTSTLSSAIADNTITNFAPSKTFNLAGLQVAYNVIPNPDIRKTFETQLTKNRVYFINAFGSCALQAAYNESEYFVGEMCDYVEANLDYLESYIRQNIPQLSIYRPQATYLVWVDFRKTGLTPEEIKERLLRQARIAPDFGDWFGPESQYFARLNLACPRSLVERAAKGLQAAFA